MTIRRRPNGYYQWRDRVPGRGMVHRTLGTKSRKLALRRGAAVDALLDRRLDLVDAWIEDRLDLRQVVEAYESGRIDRLDGFLEASRVPTLAVAVESLLAARKTDVGKRTLQGYRAGLTFLREFHGDGIPVDEAFTPEAIQAFRSSRADLVKPATVNNNLVALSVLATHALERGWITHRPVIKKLRTDPVTIWLEGSEIAAYMAELRSAFRPIMSFLILTGCRLGEAERLRVQDLRLADDDAWATIDSTGGTRVKTPGSVRAVPLADDLVAALRRRIEDEGLAGSDKVFAPIPRRTVQKEHIRARDRAGIRKDYTIHRHRDTFAVTVARRGMPLPTLQRILGHKTIQQTMKYAGYSPSYQDAARYLNAESSGSISGPAEKARR